MSDIVLSSGVRDNLLSLQNTADLLQATQGRLATGKRINSALDGPNQFFTAEALNYRANDLTKLLDDMGQAVQVIKAADQGISAISKLVEAAKAKANQALRTADRFERARYALEYNDLLSQISGIAQDSGYNGKNLLGGAGNDLTIYFNEENSNKLVISPVDYSDPTVSMGLSNQTGGVVGVLNITLKDASNVSLTGASLISTDANDVAVGNTLTFKDGSGAVLGTVAITATTTVNDVVTAINSSFDQVRASFSAGILKIETAENVTITGGKPGGALVSASITATPSSWLTESGINASLTEVNTAIKQLRTQAATFGTNLTVVQNRESFTKTVVNTLRIGADKLVVADTNEEGANLLALQTRQQLSSTALSLAAQADQNVLRLFG